MQNETYIFATNRICEFVKEGAVINMLVSVNFAIYNIDHSNAVYSCRLCYVSVIKWCWNKFQSSFSAGFIDCRQDTNVQAKFKC